ncbi:MAG: carbohydrate ABC transporter permease [Caldicoprobacterales bacterium]|jgi:multiple sugar transport system permease protein
MIKKRLVKVILYAFFVGIVFLIIFPFLWQFITSIRDPADIFLMPPEFIPRRVSLDFYKVVFTQHNFGRYIYNSSIIGIFSTIIAVCFAIPASYAFTRIKFTGKKFWNNFILLTNMFPLIAVATPLFMSFRKVGLINTYPGLIIPSIVITLPISIWTLNAFMKKIPIELEQSAMIDGANRFQAVRLILMPLIAPGIFTAAIMAFINAWNEFMFAIIFITKKEMRTVPIAIAMMPGEYTLPWGDMAAASIVATLPILMVVVLCQKYIVAGLTAGAIKG